MPLVRRLPYRRGFKNPFRVAYTGVNVGKLGTLPAGSEVTSETLIGLGLLHKGEGPVKVLGDGELAVALTVRVDRVTAAGAPEDRGGGRERGRAARPH